MRTCFATILAIFILVLAGCGSIGGTAPQGDSFDPQPMHSSQEILRDSPAASIATGNPDKAMRAIYWDNSSLSGNGFFSLGYDVLPEKFLNGNFYGGVRLYYDDCATRQNTPLTVFGSPNVYLLEGNYLHVTASLIFTTVP